MTRLPRRAFLGRSLAAAGGTLLGPALLPAERERPALTHGVSAGDVAPGRAIVWSRADRPARMVVEYATRDSFADARRILGPLATAETGFTARVDLAALPPGQRIVYRVSFDDPADARLASAPASGTFRTPPARRADVTFAWSADTCGQGWGINPDWGGLRLYETMRRAGPDFFIHCGDTIYADQPIAPEVKLDDGTVWRNRVTPAKSRVAEALDDFRGNYHYNLMDDNVRRFNAEVPQIVLWDDHEVRNNWYPSQVLDDPHYRERRVAVLSARARQAFFEHHPLRLDPRDPRRLYRSYAYGPLLEVFALDLRSYRGPNTPNRQGARSAQTDLLGRTQLAWLMRRLRTSPATWKVVASDMPLGLVVTDGPRDFEAVANGDGPALGRELEIAELLQSLRDHDVRNVVWITGDVHYAAAHHYDPARARFRHFKPFWEFVAGPLHAGTFGPGVLDVTFGPEARFVAVPPGMKPNRPPSAGLQFFGTVRIDGRSEVMTVRLHNLTGEAIYTVELEPERAARPSAQAG